MTSVNLYDTYTGNYVTARRICIMDSIGYLVDIEGEELLFFEQEYILRFKEVPMSKKILIDKQMQDFMSVVSIYDSLTQLQGVLEEILEEGCKDELLGSLLSEFKNDAEVARVKLEKYLEDKAEFED